MDNIIHLEVKLGTYDDTYNLRRVGNYYCLYLCTMLCILYDFKINRDFNTMSSLLKVQYRTDSSTLTLSPELHYPLSLMLIP